MTPSAWRLARLGLALLRETIGKSLAFLEHD
jgi:hypothetical protein